MPAAGGVQRAFGSDAKALQVGFAAEAGVRAARLVKRGASVDFGAFDQWFELVGGDRERLDLGGPAVPGGLAVKIFPCCYALQRPIAATRNLRCEGIDPGQVERISVRTPEATIRPLIHRKPRTALEGKFSLEYAIGAVILDGYPGLSSFTDDAVLRPEAQELIGRVEVHTSPGGDSLLAGYVDVEIVLANGEVRSSQLTLPPGAPGRPAESGELAAKLSNCGEDVPRLLEDVNWKSARRLLSTELSDRTRSIDLSRRMSGTAS